MAITFAYIKMQVKQDPLCLPKIVDLKLGGLFTIRHLFSQDLRVLIQMQAFYQCFFLVITKSGTFRHQTCLPMIHETTLRNNKLRLTYV